MQAPTLNRQKNRPDGLARGARGLAVLRLQRALVRHGHALRVDGNFDTPTELAVMAFQRAHKLAADGLVGPKTFAALRAADPKRAVTSPERRRWLDIWQRVSPAWTEPAAEYRQKFQAIVEEAPEGARPQLEAVYRKLLEARSAIERINAAMPPPPYTNDADRKLAENHAKLTTRYDVLAAGLLRDLETLTPGQLLLLSPRLTLGEKSNLAIGINGATWVLGVATWVDEVLGLAREFEAGLAARQVAPAPPAPPAQEPAPAPAAQETAPPAPAPDAEAEDAAPATKKNGGSSGILGGLLGLLFGAALGFGLGRASKSMKG